MWYRLYVQLWRGLFRRPDLEEKLHSFRVLQVAQATTPMLAVAQARASFLCRILEVGPATLLHLLHAHWQAAPSKSWLGQLRYDIKAVGVYVGAAALLLDIPVL